MGAQTAYRGRGTIVVRDDDEEDLSVLRSSPRYGSTSLSQLASWVLLVVDVSTTFSRPPYSSSSSSPSKSSESSATTNGAFGCSISVCASFERLLRNRCLLDVLDVLDVFEDSEEDEMDDDGDSFDAGAAGVLIGGFGAMCSSVATAGAAV